MRRRQRKQLNWNADYMARGYNEVEAQKRVLDELKKQFDISFREVCLYDNGR